MAPRLMYLMRSRTLPFPFPCSRGKTLSNSCSSAAHPTKEALPCVAGNSTDINLLFLANA